MSNQHTAVNIQDSPKLFSSVYRLSSQAPGLETPPDSNSIHNYMSADTQEESIVSSSFFPGSHNSVSDIVFRSSDGVLFYLNTRHVLRASDYAFEQLLGSPLTEERFKAENGAVINIPELAAVLDIIVHAIYKLSCARHLPTFDDLETAVYRMSVYGIDPQVHIAPTNPLFDLLLCHAPLHPIRVYTLAGHFRAHELAAKTSSHLLSYNLANLTDELTIRMGSIYLNKLMILHLSRIDSLKNIILQPPIAHAKTRTCDTKEQKKLGTAWALAASYLVWDACPDVAIHRMQSTFEALGDNLTCDGCKETLKARTKEVIVQWVKVKVSRILLHNLRY